MDLDEVILNMYASMSFDRGGEPDWKAQNEVFEPHARLVRVRDDGVYEFDPRTFREDFEDMIRSGVLPSLFEREVSREARVFGDIAHVLSAYEIRTSRDGELVSRAIKSIQLYATRGRWWISAMLWRRVSTDVILSAEEREGSGRRKANDSR
ncbi:MAG TPA: hypothetical protein VLU46_01680 [Thermoanaerobaculia bacterium]|nr:hypothetical protein [Thermoanaerobaculia bacterium]